MPAPAAPSAGVAAEAPADAVPGAAAARAPAASAPAAGKGKKDEEKKQAPRDLFDDGEDWIDDEGAAPDVLS